MYYGEIEDVMNLLEQGEPTLGETQAALINLMRRHLALIENIEGLERKVEAANPGGWKQER
jgi:hypothetical protein